MPIRCESCPPGANCTQSHLDDNQPAPGYWRHSSASPIIYTCRLKEACIGGSAARACALGHTGPLCDVCQPGFFRGPGTQGCLMCSSAARLTNIAVAASVFVALPVLLVLLCAVLDIRRRRKRNPSFTPARTSGTAASSAPPQHVTHGSRAGRMSAVGLRLGHSAAAAVATLKAPLKKMPAELRARWTVKVRTRFDGPDPRPFSPAFAHTVARELFAGAVLSSPPQPGGDAWPGVRLAHYDWHATLVQTTILPPRHRPPRRRSPGRPSLLCARPHASARLDPLPRGSVGVGHARHSQSDSRGACGASTRSRWSPVTRPA